MELSQEKVTSKDDVEGRLWNVLFGYEEPPAAELQTVDDTSSPAADTEVTQPHFDDSSLESNVAEEEPEGHVTSWRIKMRVALRNWHSCLFSCTGRVNQSDE